ncbi:MAG: sugar ABC transporter ATP-binding protein [Ignisphaera sp.]
MELNVNNGLLVLENIWKRFPGVVALKGVSMCVKKGEIIGLVGENGAGKSTLLKIIFGIFKPDSGRILWKGREVHIENPLHAMKMGIFYVPQELLLPPNLSIAEATMMGIEIRGGLKIVNYKQLSEEAKKIMSIVGIENLDPKTKIRQLDAATKQLVLIARALAMKAELLIFDEPTSSLSIAETERLLNTMLELKKNGIAQIFVSHRIEEVIKVADKIIVLRDGYKIAEYDNTTKKISIEEIIRAMIAREIKEFYPKVAVPIGDVILEVRNLTTKTLHKVSFNVRRGEIVGIFGLLGSGIYEIPKAITGLIEKTEGELLLDGKQISIRSPTEAIRKYGIIYIPEDRRNLGLFSLLPIRSNITISSLDILSKYKAIQVIDNYRERDIVSKLMKTLNIVPPDPSRKVMYLSGGNQQKTLISRAFSRPVKVVFLGEPTVGVDVGAKVEIRKLMVELASKGCGIVLISDDVHEVLGMSDRIIVVSKGRVVAETLRSEATAEKLLEYASR